MTRFYYEDEHVYEDAPVDGMVETADYSSKPYDDDSLSQDDYWANREYIENVVDTSPEPTLWNQLQIGETLLYISNMGCLRRAKDPFWCITRGVPLTGTPYSYVMLETKPGESTMFFIHHLVWKAFHGDVPPGWEVRHKPCVPMEYTREYPNELALLDMYPSML
jgi:hypothetical protein